MKICSLASGSSGNCYYIGTGETNILIDAGISGKRIVAGLENLGVRGTELDGIFVTHEHSDHIQSLGVLARKFNTPLYATGGTWKGMTGKLGKVEADLCQTLHSKGSLEIGDINLEWFATSHDANEPVGYLVENENKFVGLATDTGILNKEMINALVNIDMLILEANHDEEMLFNGRYPQYLKKRIGSSLGHLSNVSAGQALVELAGERTKAVFLAHLSQENNRPGLALKTIGDIITEHKIAGGFELQVAPRSQASSCIRL
ncbi:MAG: MBL fold metallo-hydrolase [Peptococcaceae bacterium]